MITHATSAVLYLRARIYYRFTWYIGTRRKGNRGKEQKGLSQEKR